MFGSELKLSWSGCLRGISTARKFGDQVSVAIGRVEQLEDLAKLLLERKVGVGMMKVMKIERLTNAVHAYFFVWE